MSTSLATQLRKLAVPQTASLHKDKRRASLLFDAKEAANLDRGTIYEIGFQGLQELKKLTPVFAEFEKTLFDSASKDLQRAVQTKETNEKLDREIQRFFFHLSPFFLLRSAHQTLEWLINRFQIHQYNVDDLMVLLLPYHESKIFVRALQLINNVKDQGSRWAWLRPSQKEGVSLSKLALLNHCAQNSSFFHFVCEMPLRAVKMCGPHCATLNTMFTFCCTTIIGALEYSSEVTDIQVGHVLKLLLKSLRSEFIEICATGIMITAQLARRTKLAGNVLKTLVNKIAQVPHDNLEMERTILLVLLYDTQQEALTSIPHKALLRLAESTYFLKSLADLGESHADVAQLLIVVIQDSLKGIMSQDENSVILKQFCADLLAAVKLEDEDAEALVLTLANVYITKENVDEDNESDMEIDRRDEICEWFSSYLRDIEKKYPVAFDVGMKKVLEATQEEAMRKNLLDIVGFKPRISCLISGVDIYEKLNHPLEAMRVEGVRYFRANYKKFQEDDNESLQQVMRNCLQDDSNSVLNEILEFPTLLLASIVGKEYFVELMIQNATKVWYRNKMDSSLRKKIIHCLCCSVSLETKEHAVMLAVLLHVLPRSSDDMSLAIKALKSEFCLKNKFFKAVISDIPSLEDLKNPYLLCTLVFKRMCERKYIPDVDTLSELVQSMSIFETEPVYKLLSSILMTSAVKDIGNANIKWKVMDKVLKYFESADVSVAVSKIPVELKDSDALSKCMAAARKKILPIQGLMFCLSTLSKHLELPQEVCERPWWHIATKEKDFEITSALLFIRLFGALQEHSMTEGSSGSYEFSNLSNKLFKKCFPDEISQLGFLSNLWVAHELGQVHEKVIGETLQLRALKLAKLVLQSSRNSWQKCEEIIIPPLLIALSSPSADVRKATLAILSFMKHPGEISRDVGYHYLRRKLLEHQKEIEMDPEQISVCMYTTLSPDSDVQSLIPLAERKISVKVTKTLFSCVVHDDTPLHIRVALLRILAHVNSKEILENLVPVGQKMLSHALKTGRVLDYYRSAVISSIISRFDSSVAECVEENGKVWKFFENCLKDFTTVIQVDGKDISPTVIAMNQVTKSLYEALPHRQQTILNALLYVGTETDSPHVVSIVGNVVKRIVLNCRHVVVVLEEMRDMKAEPRAVKAPSSPGTSVAVLKTPAWRRGTTLLELIQNKKKLHSIHLIVPVLFDILKRCLESVEQASMEYVKQLILSCILNCCTKLSSGEVDLSEIALERIFNVELVVKCIRASQNPQTHHHALLVLSHLATLLPEQVLHNIMAIFTFMGSSVLRQDDAYSFQIISEVVDAVIPVLVKAQVTGVDPSKLYNPVAGILRVFVDAFMDIPEHRQIPLFQKLMGTIGAEHFLWLLMALLIESQARQKPGAEKNEEGFLPKRLNFGVAVSLQFPPATVLANSVILMEYLLSLTADKEQKEKWHHKQRRAGVAAVTSLLNVAQCSKSQFHHYKYAIVVYLCGILGHSDFINMVAALPVDDARKLEPIYVQLIEIVLQHIQIVAHSNELNIGKPTAKYWKAMLNQSYELMDRVNALLLSDMFLKVILSLLDNPIFTVRRKAMELMNARLQNLEFFTSCKPDDLLSMTKPLLNIISTISEENSSLDHHLNQQTALTSVKLLARLMASNHAELFASVFDDLTTLIKLRAPQGNVLASAMLCAAELCSCLEAYAIRNLPNFMPLILEVLSKEKRNKNPDVVLLAIVTSVYKIVESLPNFLSPYLKKILFEIAVLCARFQVEAETQKTAPIVQKLKYIKQTLSSEIPLRILVPVIHECYTRLLRKREMKAISSLMDILIGSFSNLSNADFKNLKTELTNFFMAALQFRSDSAEGDKTEEDIEFVESHVIRALVALIVKLSESSFRPLYYNMYHWATAFNIHKERLITFYRVSHGIAESLKGLFILFAGHFIKNAATILLQTNPAKSKSLVFGSGEAAEAKNIVLLESVLKTLHSLFLYDSANFLTKERFDTLMQPLVDQLENTLGGVDSLTERTKSLLTPCIVQFGFVAADDTLWKQLNYQILLKMRHSLPAIRLIALETLHGLVSKLREDFLPQMPETVPFLAELLEDEEEVVENACVRVVQDMEEILGEPLKKYF